MIKFYINLDSCADRKEYFDSSFKRWIATPRDKVDDLTDKRMISYHNVTRDYHLGKCGCFKSHTLLLQYIVDNKINNVLICEDDAEQISPLPFVHELGEGFVYLGGYFLNKKRTEGEYKGDSGSVEGLNELIDKEFDVCMTMSYYIGSWEVAKELLDEINSLKRWRAIDILYMKSKVSKKYYFPAIFKERPLESTIRKGKRKHANEYYRII
jgi:GR25 family glycosyltransferase involved in LPS biosynthesis